MAKICLALLCKFGDIAVSAIPIAKHFHDNGDEVSIVVSPSHSAILDCCSYIKKLEFSTHVRDVDGAVRFAEKMECFDKILALQVDGNPDRPPTRVSNFVLEEWSRAGLLHKFHAIPLVFDKRFHDLDEQAVKLHVPKDDGRPLLGYNVATNPQGSSMYRHGIEQGAWIRRTFGKQYRLLDLGNTCLRHVCSLLALLEKCSALISIDSLTMHLSYATNTPLIAYSIGRNPQGEPDEYYDSEPHANWVYRCSYDHSVSPEGRAEVSRILETQDFASGKLVRNVVPLHCRLSDPVVHVVDWFEGDKDTKERIGAARRTFDRHSRYDPNYRLVLHELEDGQRSSKDIGDSRGLPYLKDVIIRGCDNADDSDIVIFSNTDVCLTVDAVGMVRQWLWDAPCCFSRRTDCNIAFALIDRMSGESKGMPDVGSDLFAARKAWWLDHLVNLPDALIGSEGFDFCFRHYFWKCNPNAEIKPSILLHPAHRPYWSLTNVIHDNPSQKYNRSICREWAIANGLEAALHDGKQLFKLDEWWMQ